MVPELAALIGIAFGVFPWDFLFLLSDLRNFLATDMGV